jgi:hypothetical protein
MADLKQGSFEGWGVIELFGHSRETGFITTETYGAAVLFRVDVPGLEEREYTLTAPEYASGKWTPEGSKVKRAAVPARSRLIGPGAIYALNPCTEDMARKVIEKSIGRDLILVELAPGKVQMLPGEGAPDQQEPDEDDAYEDREDEGR